MIDKDVWFVLKIFLPLAFLMSAFGFTAWVLESYWEAKAFQRVTGKEVSTWDAMFLELRVDDD